LLGLLRVAILVPDAGLKQNRPTLRGNMVEFQSADDVLPPGTDGNPEGFSRPIFGAVLPKPGKSDRVTDCGFIYEQIVNFPG
jgi:hypothetical protein